MKMSLAQQSVCLVKSNLPFLSAETAAQIPLCHFCVWEEGPEVSLCAGDKLYLFSIGGQVMG